MNFMRGKTSVYFINAATLKFMVLAWNQYGILKYAGKEYALVDKRMPQKDDKTKDESYFILTLFAIGKELASEANSCSDEIKMMLARAKRIKVELLAGLPPIHCKEMGAKYKEYFKNQGEQIDFEFNKTSFSIHIQDVHIYPQAFASAITIHDKISKFKTINIIDIGGYTVDLLQLTNFKPNMNLCTSLYSGVNLLFQQINEISRAKGMKDIPYNIIEGILLNDSDIISGTDQEKIYLIKENAEKFTNELLADISQTGMDFAQNQTVFVGGGSCLLKSHIEDSGIVSNPIFIDDVRANVEGYWLLHQARNQKEERF